MKKLSLKLLTDTAKSRRKALSLTQTELSKRTGINRTLLSRLEAGDFTPSVDQLIALSEVLDFNMNDLFTEQNTVSAKELTAYRIAVAGTGYVGLSLAVLLAGNHQVTAVDIIEE